MILIGVVAVVLLVLIETRYEAARDFETANWIDFRHYVMFHRSICHATKKAMEQLYNNARPSIWKLVFSIKPLSRKHYFSEGHIEIFFSRYDEELYVSKHKYEGVVKDTDYTVIEDADQYLPIKNWNSKTKKSN